MIQTLEWTPKGVRFIDQTKLPTEEVYVNCTTHQQVADVIRNMVVRGAPAIGVAAGMGIALGVQNSKAENGAELKKDFDAAKADYRVIEYPGAVHSFTNPEATELGKKFNLPLRYDAQVDKEAKAEAAKFFAANVQK